MKKAYLLSAMAGLLMVSCVNDEIINPVNQGDKANAPMTFSMGVKNLSRDDTPFETVMDNFGVFAAKVNGNDAAAWDAAFKGMTWSDATNGLDEKVIMNNYKVVYDATNTAWVYDGVTGDALQYLKYWDGSYKKTYFIGYAPFGTSTSPVAEFDNTAPSLYFPSITVTSDPTRNYLFSNIKIEDNAAHVAAATANTVPLTFNSLQSQVKIAIYEAIPGYTVEMAELVFDGKTDPHGIVAIPADVTGTTWSKGKYVSEGKAKVTYSNVSPATGFATQTVSYTDADMGGANLEFDLPVDAVGHAVTIGNSYAKATPIATTYYVLPNDGVTKPTAAAGKTITANSGLQFVMNYTLKSKDTNEVINVKGARVYVQPAYTAWARNTVYTYVFRITTASSGTTTPNNPSADPEEPGKALYPIVFDHLIVAKMEDGAVVDEWDIDPETGVNNPHNPSTHD